MARGGPKRHGPKPPKSPVMAPATKEPPKPFVLAPSRLNPFLEALPKDGFYLTHIDRTSRVEKQQLFMAPALLNLGFALVLLARLYYAIPQYFSLLSAFLGYDSQARVDTEHTPFSDLINILLRRSGLLVLDYCIYTLLGRWVLRFIQEETYWRWSVGFKDEEVVVRVSKKWHNDLSSRWTSTDEKRIAEKVVPALDPLRIEKSSLQLVDASFVLDTDAMVTAADLVYEGDLELADFDRVVLVHYPPSDGWIMLSLAAPRNPKKGNDNLAKLQENLISKGKEDLFFRYVEIVQYEASQPDVTGLGYQEKAWAELEKAFEEQGVDLSLVREEMGGERKMPFFEDASPAQ